MRKKIKFRVLFAIVCCEGATTLKMPFEESCVLVVPLAKLRCEVDSHEL